MIKLIKFKFNKILNTHFVINKSVFKSFFYFFNTFLFLIQQIQYKYYVNMTRSINFFKKVLYWESFSYFVLNKSYLLSNNLIITEFNENEKNFFYYFFSNSRLHLDLSIVYVQEMISYEYSKYFNEFTYDFDYISWNNYFSNYIEFLLKLNFLCYKDDFLTYLTDILYVTIENENSFLDYDNAELIIYYNLYQNTYFSANIHTMFNDQNIYNNLDLDVQNIFEIAFENSIVDERFTKNDNSIIINLICTNIVTEINAFNKIDVFNDVLYIWWENFIFLNQLNEYKSLFTFSIFLNNFNDENFNFDFSYFKIDCLYLGYFYEFNYLNETDNNILFIAEDVFNNIEILLDNVSNYWSYSNINIISLNNLFSFLNFEKFYIQKIKFLINKRINFMFEDVIIDDLI